MTESSKFNIDNKAVDKIIELREQEPGDKEYALFPVSYTHLTLPTKA